VAPAGPYPECAICLARATERFLTDHGRYSDPTASARRSWCALPPVDLCSSCFTLAIRGRVVFGWCTPGEHWGPENADCMCHKDCFRPPGAPGRVNKRITGSGRGA
jgi:hypothetical protein